MSGNKVAILTNIPTPYRTSFFNNISDNISDFKVFYCAKTEPRRFWKFDKTEVRYLYKFLSGFQVSLYGMYLHFNSIFPIWKYRPSSIIVAGAWNTPTMLLTLLYARCTGKSIYFWSEGHSKAQKSNSKYVASVRALVYKRFSGFVVPNTLSKNYVQGIVGVSSINSVIVPNTIDEKSYGLEQNTVVVEGLENFDGRVVSVIGSLTDRKGVMEVVQGIHKLGSQLQSTLKVVFAGTGPLEEELKKFCLANRLNGVIFLGHIDAKKVPGLLKASDAFLLATKLDPNPLTPIEASYLGVLPIVSSYAGNFDEIIQEGSSGLGFEKVTPDSIADILTEFLAMPKAKMNELQKNAQENARKNFSSESAAKSLIEFLHQNNVNF